MRITCFNSIMSVSSLLVKSCTRMVLELIMFLYVLFRISSDRNILETANTSVEGLGSPATKWAALTEEMITILAKAEEGTPHEGSSFSKWQQNIFPIICSIALLIDPLIFYINGNNGTSPHIGITIAYICLRWTTDILILIKGIFYQRKRGRKHGAMNHRFRQLITAVLFPIFIGFPIPQLVFIGSGTSFVVFPCLFALQYASRVVALKRLPGSGSWVKAIRDVFPFILATCIFIGILWCITYVGIICLFALQYASRVYRIYIALKRRPNKDAGFGSWLKTILDVFPFILAAHLFGALWYFFAVERQKNCWENACSIDTGCDSASLYNNDGQRNMTVVNIVNEACPIDLPNATKFDFGIYLYALQSGMTTSPNVALNMLQGFWWGLRNLSSFGSNLQTSFYSIEIVFATILSASGILLFIIYLNQILQVAKRNSEELRLSRKMQIINPEIDLWLSKKNLSNNKDLKKLIKKIVREKLHDGKDNIGQNLNILSIVPIVHRNYITSSLRLAALKKVPVLRNTKEHVLKAICNHLQPMTYSINSYILREGEPLWNIMFITEGTALAYKTNSGSNDNTGASPSNSSIIECIESGGFYGDELLNWAFAFASYSELPITMKTVISQTKLEAFCINACSLKRVVSNFPWHFGLMNLQDHEERRRFVASIMLKAWRARVERRTTGTNQLN